MMWKATCGLYTQEKSNKSLCDLFYLQTKDNTQNMSKHNKMFLEYVASDIISKYGTDLSDITIVFPNKRASLFLNDSLALEAGKPMWSPAYVTISDLFRQQSDLTVGDDIKLICDLYRVFTSVSGSSETLDHFYGWGQIILSDFDDIDKHMADADKVFAILRDIHELDSIDYLNEEQKELLAKFFTNFDINHETELKDRFLRLWSNFSTIYHDYNSLLLSEGITYEGALYRSVIDSLEHQRQYTGGLFDRKLYLFVGFNMMQPVEQRLCSILQKEGKAKFYFDFDKYYIDPDSDNEAGKFVRELVSMFGNELDSNNDEIYSNFADKSKKVAFVSASTENIQARYISTWLKTGNRISDGRRTAIVMADENLLPTIIHSLPDDTDDGVGPVNITTGYPLDQTPIASLVEMLIRLHTSSDSASGRFRLKDVSRLLRHPYIGLITPNATGLLASLNAGHVYRPTRGMLATDDALTLLFTVTENPAEPSILSITSWIADVVSLVAQGLSHPASENHSLPTPLDKESVFRMYTLLQRLQGLIASGDLDVGISTWQRLLVQLVRTETVPFHGEPAVGLQIMGLLETRNLDFDHVLLLSCNEGNLPRGIDDSSFIPYSIRKAFSLTTVDHKTAIYSYYFHSLLQRASDITIAYNTSTVNGHTGEMSRFMLQMLVGSGLNIEHITLQAGQKLTMTTPQAQPKTTDVMSVLHSLTMLSPTAINRYQSCQLKFYYNDVCGLKEPEDNEDGQIDNRVFGNIFHRSAQLIYEPFLNQGKQITSDDINGILKHKEYIAAIVDRAFAEELLHSESPASIPIDNGLQIISREVIINYIGKLLQADMQLAPFSIVGLEKTVCHEISIEPTDGPRLVNLGGKIDRLDLVTDRQTGNKQLRVVDYKTGRSLVSWPASIEDVFDTSLTESRHANYYLQTMLYSIIVSRDTRLNPNHLPVAPALLFIQNTGGKDNDPTLRLGRNQRINDISLLSDDYITNLRRVVTSIMEPSTEFMPDKDRNRCQRCPYARICGI